LKLIKGVAQLTELRPARGSPDRRSIEDHDGFRSAATLMEVDKLAMRIRKSEIRESLSNFGASRMAWRKARSSRMA